MEILDLQLAIVSTRAKQGEAMIALASYKMTEIDRPVVFDVDHYYTLVNAAEKAEKEHIGAVWAYRRHLSAMLGAVDEYQDAITTKPRTIKRETEPTTDEIYNRMVSLHEKELAA
jgi:hypothetical protein